MNNLMQTMMLLVTLSTAGMIHGQAVAQPSTRSGPSRISCDAAYNAPCSRTNSKWLATATSKNIESVSGDMTAMKQLLDDITAGGQNMDQGFYPFVVDRQTSRCVAHGYDRAFIGKTLGALFEELMIGFSSSTALHDRFNAAAEAGGDWVQYIWRTNKGIGDKIAYVTSATDQYYIGVGFEHRALPPDLPCSDKTDSWCSINNVMSLVGNAQSRLNDATSLEQFETSLFDISFDENTFQIDGGHYLFMYKFDGTLVAHAKLQAFFGQSMPDIFVKLNRKYEDGVQLHQQLAWAALGHNDGWVQYKWRNKAEESEYTKIAYVVEVLFQGEQYYIGCGYNFVMGDVLDGPLGSKCPGYNLPCAFAATLQLTSHAFSHAVSSPTSAEETLLAISADTGLRHVDYYVFMYDFNGTCVAHGLQPSFVGLRLSEILVKSKITAGVDADFLNDQFVFAASNGGGYVLYDWYIPNVPDSEFQKISYIFEVTLDGQRYYGGVGFNHQRAPLQLELGDGTTNDGQPIPCTRRYGTNCSEINTQAILGQALSDLVLTTSQTKARPDSAGVNVTNVLSAISSKNELYRANDFVVAVFAFDSSICENSAIDKSGCCLAHGGDESLVGKSWQEILNLKKITSIRGEDIHNQFTLQTLNNGESLEYVLADITGVAEIVRAFSYRFRDNGNMFYVLADFIADNPPPTCDSCPDFMECVEPDQAFCTILPEKRSVFRSAAFVTIAIVVAMIPVVGLLFCWIGRRREKMQSAAQLHKIDEQMQKLRDQMEKEQMTTAQTRKLVSSLFPENVRDQILQQLAEEENRTSTDKLTSFLASEKQSESSLSLLKGKGRAIAELFPAATVIFADIAGFTAWSSTREPAQVFQLLEGVYQHFDKLAKQYDVFKVETIGDCYVAVAGLPKKMEDHAIVMAFFANDCLAAFNKLVKQMEVALGPDTGDLRLRVGLHSGPVTAGVLKSDKARFQLFGDTVNTCSRMESMGVPGKIQVSQQTADLLKMGGKQDWVTARSNMIVAKGKGEIQTYWLTVAAVITSPKAGHAIASKHDAERTKRLVRWVTEGLGRLLKQIHGQNSRNGKVTPSRPKSFRVPTAPGTTVLEEVREIIHMPSFRDQEDVDSDDTDLDDRVTKQLEQYVANIAAMYRDNPFHNFEHAAHVTMSVMKLLSRIVAPELRSSMSKQGPVASRKHDHTYGITSDPLTQFSCAFSALIHDADHSGVPNTQVVKENPALAHKYKGSSVAEQNSVDLAWGLLMTDKFWDLRNAICGGVDENMIRFRQLVVNGVMSTDIMDRELKRLRDMRWDKAFIHASDSNPKDSSDRKATIVIDHLIQASDVAHTSTIILCSINGHLINNLCFPVQHWQVYRKWNERLFEEMLTAYLDGRSSKDPAEDWYKGELNFFDFYIIPLAKKLEACGVFGVSSFEYLGYAEQNRQEWELRGEALVESMSREIRNKLIT